MYHYKEIETPQGLEFVTVKELEPLNVTLIGQGRGSLQIEKTPHDFQGLRSAIATYDAICVPVPRPKGLLGHQYLTQIHYLIEKTIQRAPKAFETFKLGAAGDATPVMERIKSEIAQHHGLEEAENQGDLLIRIRPSVVKTGWDILIRTTPRPLITRQWRIYNMEGALNACVAYGMAQLSQIENTSNVLNLGCGSGTLMIESQPFKPKEQFGIDNDEDALMMAHEHLHLAKVEANLIHGDVTQLPFDNATFDVLTADLPFGQLVGNVQSNKQLYPLLVQEAARVCVKGGRITLITHSLRLIESVLDTYAHLWHIEKQLSVNLNGLNTRIYVLSRR